MSQSMNGSLSDLITDPLNQVCYEVHCSVFSERDFHNSFQLKACDNFCSIRPTCWLKLQHAAALNFQSLNTISTQSQLKELGVGLEL